jgi:hypothetical protein
MSRIGNCWDRGLVEKLFSTLSRTEVLYSIEFENCNTVTEWIEVSTPASMPVQRRHGQPADFEDLHRHNAAQGA